MLVDSDRRSAINDEDGLALLDDRWTGERHSWDQSVPVVDGRGLASFFLVPYQMSALCNRGQSRAVQLGLFLSASRERSDSSLRD